MVNLALGRSSPQATSPGLQASGRKAFNLLALVSPFTPTRARRVSPWNDPPSSPLHGRGLAYFKVPLGCSLSSWRVRAPTSLWDDLSWPQEPVSKWSSFILSANIDLRFLHVKLFVPKEESVELISSCFPRIPVAFAPSGLGFTSVPRITRSWCDQAGRCQGALSLRVPVVETQDSVYPEWANTG